MNNDIRNYVLNKNWYIVDNVDSICDLEFLRKSLIEEVKRDTIENGSEDSDIIKYNLELLEKIYNVNSGYNENFIIEELSAFGYSITKVDKIMNDLYVLKDFWNSLTSSEIKNELVEKVEDLIKEMENYFND